MSRRREAPATDVEAEGDERSPAGAVDSENDAPPRQATVGGSIANLTNNILGAGVLPLPWAVRMATFFPGMLLLFIVWVANTYSFILIARCCSLSSASTFKDAGTRAFGAHKGLVVQALMLLYSMGTCIGHVDVIGDFIPHTFQYLMPDSIFTDRVIVIFVFALGILWPLSSQRDLSSLRYTSVLAVACIAYALGLLVVREWQYGHINPSAAFLHGSWTDFFVAWPLFGVSMTAHYNAPKFFSELRARPSSAVGAGSKAGLVADGRVRKKRGRSDDAAARGGAYTPIHGDGGGDAGVGGGGELELAVVEGEPDALSDDEVVLASERRVAAGGAVVATGVVTSPGESDLASMTIDGADETADAEAVAKWTRVAATSTSTCLIIFIVCGTSGVFRFGDEVDGNILDNLGNDDGAAVVARVGLAAAVSCAYPLVCNCMRNAFEGVFCAPGEASTVRRYAETLLLVACTVAVALAVPEIEVVFAFKGAIIGSFIVYILPAMMYIKLREAYGVEGDARLPPGISSFWDLWGPRLLIAFGCCNGIFGTYGAAMHQQQAGAPEESIASAAARLLV